MLTQFENLLKQRIGLHPLSIGLSTIERAVRRRMAASRSASLEDYWKRITASDVEIVELIEAVVVPETWFFRGIESFQVLSKAVHSDAGRNLTRFPFRMLSIPCCTGEEPCSIAMRMLLDGVAPKQFSVDAFDISSRALEIAAGGIYGKNSFRGTDLSYRERYFKETPRGFLLSSDVRSRVNYRVGNLLDDSFLPGAQPYDIIFCRNLLIYFDDSTQERALNIIDRLLAPDGWLFVGPAEAGLLMNRRFVSSKVPQAFAFRKAGAGASGEIKRMPVSVKGRTPAAPRTVCLPSKEPTSPVRLSSEPVSVFPPPTQPVLDLDTAAKLADSGQLRQAAELCEGFLKFNSDSARAYCLLATLREAIGQGDTADDLYRKALFLDPDNYEALMHLACRAERRGDSASEKKFRERARRVLQRMSHD